jgi:YfiH family protein
MPFYQQDQLRYYRFDLFEMPGIVHGIYTRQGGVSPLPWASLNHGGTVGDKRSNVVENRRKVFESVNRPVESVFDVWQEHGAQVICSDYARPLDSIHQKADAILTDYSEITLFMRFADCVPILLYDPVRSVIGIVHAGWQGTVKKIADGAIRTMQNRYRSNPSDILAGIGPSIGVEKYPIGSEVVEKVIMAFGQDAEGLLKGYNGSKHLDLWEANRLILEESGVRHIQVAGICTASNTTDWYSHRAENGKTGRFGAIIALNSGAV